MVQYVESPGKPSWSRSPRYNAVSRRRCADTRSRALDRLSK